MLRISKMTDYAVVLATHLAASEGPHAARDLAVQTQIPEPTASKVLKKLARAGVVISQRGPKGGYALGRPASEISVAEIISALEGPIALTECSAGPGHCEQESFCGVRAPWQRINRAIQDTLCTVTLDQLAHADSVPILPLASGPRPTRGDHV